MFPSTSSRETSGLSGTENKTNCFPRDYTLSVRHVNCIRVGYAGTFVDGMCSNCASIDKINTFRCKVWRRAKESKHPDPANKVRFEFLSHTELCEKLRESRKREEQLYHKTFLLSRDLR